MSIMKGMPGMPLPARSCRRDKQWNTEYYAP